MSQMDKPQVQVTRAKVEELLDAMQALNEAKDAADRQYEVVHDAQRRLTMAGLALGVKPSNAERKAMERERHLAELEQERIDFRAQMATWEAATTNGRAKT